MLHFRQDGSPNSARMTRLPAPRRHIVATDQGPLDVADIGRQDARAILLITHGLGSLESFEEIAEGLEGRFPGRRIIAFSRPGRGKSPPSPTTDPTDPLSREAMHVLPALLRALGITSADLIAHGDGVAIAMLFACTHPWMVDRLVAISPQVHADHQFTAITQELLADGRYREHIARLQAEHADPDAATGCWTALRQALIADPDRVLRQLDALEAPLLLIQGLKDDQGAPHQMSTLSERVPGAMNWVILRNDGHFPQHDSTEMVLDLICGHLEQPLAATGGKLHRMAV